MMKIRMHVLFGVAAVFVLVLGANLNNYARAEDQDTVLPSGNKSVSLSPSIDKLGYLKPGETYKREITAVNPNDEDISFKVSTSSFWVEDDNYEVKWGVSSSQYGKIANWTDIDTGKTHTVKAGETYRFEYSIAVPKDQAGGAQRLMVTINFGATSGGEGFVAAETHANLLVFANVEGDVHPGARIVSQDIQGFSFAPSISTNSVVENTGDVDLDVVYRVSATNFFGGDEAFSLEEEKVLMTESTRMFEQKWTDAPYLGVFNVKQEITVLGETHEFNKLTIICPLWLIIVLVAMIVLIVVYIVYRQRSRGKRRVRE